MAWNDPAGVQDPTTNVVALAAWGDAVNESFNFLRGTKAGCRLTSSVGTAITSDTVLPWGTETYDDNGCHDTGSLTERIVVPSGWAGLWFVGVQLVCTNNIFTVQIVVNATTRIVGQSSNTSGAVDSSCSCSTIWEMAVGDYFEVWVTGGANRSSGIFYAEWLHSDA